MLLLCVRGVNVCLCLLCNVNCFSDNCVFYHVYQELLLAVVMCVCVFSLYT